jgi:hypothetical protein
MYAKPQRKISSLYTSAYWSARVKGTNESRRKHRFLERYSRTHIQTVWMGVELICLDKRQRRTRQRLIEIEIRRVGHAVFSISFHTGYLQIINEQCPVLLDWKNIAGKKRPPPIVGRILSPEPWVADRELPIYHEMEVELGYLFDRSVVIFKLKQRRIVSPKPVPVGMRAPNKIHTDRRPIFCWPGGGKLHAANVVAFQSSKHCDVHARAGEIAQLNGEAIPLVSPEVGIPQVCEAEARISYSIWHEPRAREVGLSDLRTGKIRQLFVKLEWTGQASHFLLFSRTRHCNVRKNRSAHAAAENLIPIADVPTREINSDDALSVSQESVERRSFSSVSGHPREEVRPCSFILGLPSVLSFAGAIPQINRELREGDEGQNDRQEVNDRTALHCTSQRLENIVQPDDNAQCETFFRTLVRPTSITPRRRSVTAILICSRHPKNRQEFVNRARKSCSSTSANQVEWLGQP